MRLKANDGIPSAWPARATTGTIAALVVAALLAALACACAAASGERALARSAHVLNVRDEGRLRFLSSSGSQLIDEGPATGTLRGKVQLRFTYDGSPSVGAQFTIFGPGWSIRARGQGRLSDPTSLTPSFRGSLTISGGSGRYAHARGSGELFGVFNRRSYGLTVQAIGKLTY
ncbi:MAG TPA: hypothetical protein VGX69_00595 [Solirubrobacteraceae bacterium]|jgi:hypothetical protein|nr:hypothetical protein [Solirubrobacteraceae bacterium]